MSSKKEILTRECIRVILSQVGWMGRRVTKHLHFFMTRMQVGRFDMEFRFHILKFEMIVEEQGMMLQRGNLKL